MDCAQRAWVLLGKGSNVHVQVILTMRFGIFNPLLQNLLSLFDELSVQINCVGLDAPVGVVLAEDKFGRLFVIFLHLAPVRLALLRQLFGARAIAVGVGFLGLFRRVSTLSSVDAIIVR